MAWLLRRNAASPERYAASFSSTERQPPLPLRNRASAKDRQSKSDHTTLGRSLCQKPLRPIRRHPGQDHANRIASGAPCDGLEQDVNARSLMMHGRPFLDPDQITCAALLQNQMTIARCHKGDPGDDQILVARLAHL